MVLSTALSRGKTLPGSRRWFFKAALDQRSLARRLVQRTQNQTKTVQQPHTRQSQLLSVQDLHPARNNRVSS
jgi:hypothetical protein